MSLPHRCIRHPLLLSVMVGSLASLSPAPLSGQTVEEALRVLAEENARLYLDPLTRGLGFAMNGGSFDSARPLGRFGFDLGVRVMAAAFSDEAESFLAVLPSSVDYGGRTYTNPYVPSGSDGTTPTVIGAGTGVLLQPSGQYRSDLVLAGENPDDYNIRFPDGQLDLSAIPFALAHVSLGFGVGTEIGFRFIPEIEIHSEVGSLSSGGFTAKHELTHWFPSPVDVSVVWSTQSVTVGDYLEGSATQYGVIAGAGFGPLSVYATGSMRESELDVSYTFENPDGNPALPPDGERLAFATRVDSGLVFGAGLKLQLLLLNLSAQYTADDFQTLSVKVGIGLP